MSCISRFVFTFESSITTVDGQSMYINWSVANMVKTLQLNDIPWACSTKLPHAQVADWLSLHGLHPDELLDGSAAHEGHKGPHIMFQGEPIAYVEGDLKPLLDKFLLTEVSDDNGSAIYGMLPHVLSH